MAGLLFSKRPALGQRQIPALPLAAVMQLRLCPFFGPSGRRARPGSGAGHTACRTPGSCQHPEPAITRAAE